MARVAVTTGTARVAVTTGTARVAVTTGTARVAVTTGTARVAVTTGITVKDCTRVVRGGRSNRMTCIASKASRGVPGSLAGAVDAGRPKSPQAKSGKLALQVMPGVIRLPAAPRGASAAQHEDEVGFTVKASFSNLIHAAHASRRLARLAVNDSKVLGGVAELSPKSGPARRAATTVLTNIAGTQGARPEDVRQGIATIESHAGIASIMPGGGHNQY
jgi:hypothetical protein